MNDLLRDYISTLLEQSQSNTELDEFSGAGAVAGMVLPLGMSPSTPVFKKPTKRKSKKKKSK